MERREQRFCAGKFSKNSAIDWLKRGQVAGGGGGVQKRKKSTWMLEVKI